MPRPRFLILLATIAFSGCTMIPKYERPVAPGAGSYPRGTETNAPSAADTAWRDFAADERLQKLIELGLVNNRDLRVAMLNVEQSRAQYRITRSSLFPGIDAGGGASRVAQRIAPGNAGYWLGERRRGPGQVQRGRRTTTGGGARAADPPPPVAPLPTAAVARA